MFSEKKQRIRKHRIATLRLQAYPVYYNLSDKDILMLKDEIKKCNALIALGNKEKEKLKNEILVINKHLESVNSKISQVDGRSNEFMLNVSMLMKERTQNK